MNDTYPHAEKVQISLLRKAGVSKRFALLRSLSETTIQLSRRAIAKANPILSEEERDLKFVAYHYGENIANRLRIYLAANSQ